MFEWVPGELGYRSHICAKLEDQSRMEEPSLKQQFRHAQFDNTCHMHFKMALLHFH